MTHHVRVLGLPPWAEPRRLLGSGEWSFEGQVAHATLTTRDAAALQARLRGLGIGGSPLEVEVHPALPRAAVRAARAGEARARWRTTPGFTRAGTRLDEEGRWSLTPESLALAMGRLAGGRSVVDAGCGAGGNAIGFARAGSPVVAVERDPGRLEMARHNAGVYGVADRIRFVEGDVRAIVPTLSADVLFVDPPWGVDWTRRYTSLESVPLLAEVLALRGDRYAEVWAKVPPSFDVASVPGAAPRAFYGEAEGDRHRVKFLLLRVPGTAGTGG